MQFFYSEPQNELEKMLGGFFCINAVGTIETGDDAIFAKFLDQHRPPAHMVVYIDSNGGDLEAAIGIGRLIRSYGLWTDIGKYLLDFDASAEFFQPRQRMPGNCMSAATMIYIGGRLRYFGQDSKFGVHRFSFKNPVPEHLGQSQVLSAQLATYVVEMGISPKFLELSSATDAREINLIDESRLKEYGVVTGGETNVEWSVQARGKMIYVRGERDSVFGRHKVMLGYSKEMGFFFWAVIEAQNRFDELLGFGLVEIVLNGEECRIDISQDCNRFQTGSDVQVISTISRDNARAISESDSFGIQIRFGEESPTFLGVSALPTEGGQEQLTSLFHNCG